MSLTLIQLNTIKQTQFFIQSKLKLAAFMLFCFGAMLNENTANAQCPVGDPLGWAWLQNVINNSNDCFDSKICQFEYDGATYFQTFRGASQSCLSDIPNNFYDCQGNLICKTGGITPLDFWCDQEISTAANNSCNIIYEYSEEQTNTCNTYLGSFFYADCGGVSYYFIELEDGRIFDPYFAVDPGYYPEEGQQIRFDFEMKTDVSTPCDISESPITITCFEPYEPIEVSTCDLPFDQGNDCSTPPYMSYYYSAETGGCQSFTYSGCGGNANNYETYSECMNACNAVLSCPNGDPLQWDWIQEMINQENPCVAGSIYLQEYEDGNFYVKIYPGDYQVPPPSGAPPAPCQPGGPTLTYTCEGQFLCRFEPVHSPTPCNLGDLGEVVTSTFVWEYEFDCANPFELSIVQNAIEDNCTNAIHTFEYEGDTYIYIKNGCDQFDVVYNCKTTISCSRYTIGFGSSACPSLIDAVQPLINDYNAIWTNSCTYENTGTVEYSNSCGLYISCCLDSQFEIVALPEGFNLEEGQRVEFSYEAVADEDICLPLGAPVEIICIRVAVENCGCPSSFYPVCGLDGNTYNNTCEAVCQGVEVADQGACETCSNDEPLQIEWIKELIIRGDGCVVNEIRQFEYNRTAHYAVLPNAACVSDMFINYYDCIGNLICASNILFSTNCDTELLEAANSASTIWTYNEAGCANPLQTNFVQNWLNADCQPEAIYSFGFEGETFIYVEPGGNCYNSYIDEADLFYNCNSDITCNLTSAFLGYYDFSCFGISESVLISALNNDNLIWTKPCEYELTGEVIHIGDVIPIEYVNDPDCDLIINVSINGEGFTISPISLPDDFTLTLGQIVELSFRHTYNIPASACTDESPVEIICIREAGGNPNNMDRIECPPNHTTSICAPVSKPAAMTMENFSTSSDANYMNTMYMQIDEQTDVQQYFTTTTRTYTISDESSNQKTCETKHHIANQFLQMPEVAQPSTICEEDLWSYLKIGTDQYKIYADNNGGMGEEMSTCNTPSLICSTANFGVDTKVPKQYNLWATTYFEFPDGTICESQPAPFYVDVKAKPTAALSMQNQTMSIGEVMTLMDVVSDNKSGYWTGENIIYLLTATGDNIAYFSANEAGVYKLYYTVRNDHCERSYLMIVEVNDTAVKPTILPQNQKPLLSSFQIYPNPTSSFVYINIMGTGVSLINLTDISGKITKKLQTDMYQSTLEIDVSDFPKGMYLMELKNEGHSQIQKLIIE